MLSYSFDMFIFYKFNSKNLKSKHVDKDTSLYLWDVPLTAESVWGYLGGRDDTSSQALTRSCLFTLVGSSLPGDARWSLWGRGAGGGEGTGGGDRSSRLTRGAPAVRPLYIESWAVTYNTSRYLQWVDYKIWPTCK